MRRPSQQLNVDEVERLAALRTLPHGARVADPDNHPLAGHRHVGNKRNSMSQAISDDNQNTGEAGTGVLDRHRLYRNGVADGAQCRRSGAAITKVRLIAINDPYSAGFRAGYFQRDW